MADDLYEEFLCRKNSERKMILTGIQALTNFDTPGQEKTACAGRHLSEHSFVYRPRALRGHPLSEHSLLSTCALQVIAGRQ